MTDNVVNLSPNRNPILSKCWRLLPVSSLYRKIDFPPQNSNVTSRCAAGSICFLLAVCFIIDERESEEQRVSYLFWGRCEDAREEHHATGNTANLRENVLGEVSVNTGIRFEFDENISQTVDARLEDDPVWLRLPPPICTVMLSLQTPALPLRACWDARPCRCEHQPFDEPGASQGYVKWTDCPVYLIAGCCTPMVASTVLLTERWHGHESACSPQAAGSVLLLMQSSKPFTNCIPPALCRAQANEGTQLLLL